MILAQSSEQPFVRWDWIWDHLDDIWVRTVEHVTLTAVAVAVGVVISLGLSLLAIRYRRSYGPITWFTGLLYTIPSLGLFAFLVPFTGLSILTAEIGLVSYTLLILIRNIVAGIDGVPPAVLEAAYGMGYTSRKAFWEVQMPLAFPVVVAGLRVASVTTVGLVTVTSLIGQGGYGAFILRGLRRDFPTEILVGIVLSVVLAVVLDLLLLRIERTVAPWTNRRLA
jgi:osmoprotectant transport system permease protein